MSKQVIGYIRVSTSMQAESGLSIEAQRAKIEAHCICHDLTLIDIIEDAGESAKDLNRPGIQKVIALADAGEIDGVVIAKLDRLTRSMRDLHQLLDQVFSKVELHCVAESINTGSAAGRLVRNVLMSVSAWEREAIGERTSEALQAKKAKGERTGNPPYGWRREGGSWVEDPAEQRNLARIKELRSRGWTLRAIKAELEERGILNRSGKVSWGIGVLSRALAA